MLAAITDLDGRIVGVNRTWLDVEHLSVADLDAPRKVLGALLGHGIRFGRVTDRLLAGEGIETVLSLKSVLPELPMVSALTANHLAALLFTDDRSEERRVGKECVSTCRSRWWPYH